MNVLVLYHATQTFTNTVFEHLNAFARFSGNRYFFCHHDQREAFGVDLSRFDAVLFHYCLRLPYDQVSEEAANALAAYPGLKVLFIQDEYDSQPVLVPAYGERLGIPIVSFSIVTYWDRYYVSRPFYRERERWYHRPPPHHAPPPPPRRPWANPQRRDDNRADHDRDDRRSAPAPYRRAEPAPGHAPPYVPAGRQGPPASISASPATR